MLKVVDARDSLLEVLENMLDVSTILHKLNVALRDGHVILILLNLLLLPHNLHFQVLVVVFKLKKAS